MSKPKLMTIVAGLGLYLVSTGVSYAGFSYFKQGQTELVDLIIPTSEKRSGLDLSAPKTEKCPLNGQMYTSIEKDIWSTRRPLSVMIENHLDARPQSGLSKADIIYEVVAEGGITRFMAVYLCGASVEDVQIGPVRSARTFFLDWASEYGVSPLYVHVGGANCDPRTGSGCANGAKADALGQIRKYGWEAYNDMNQFSIGFPTFWRDYDRLGREVATEHTMYSTTDKLWDEAGRRGLANEDKDGQAWDETYVPWKFTDQEATDRGDTAPSYYFWKNQLSADYDVAWMYDKENNQYLRSNGGKPHNDLNYEKQIAVKNLVVAFMDESKANDGYQGNLHLLYKNKGVGEALVFKDGQVTEATWNKKDRTDRTVFKDSADKEILFNPGLIWISILPTGNEVTY